MFKKKDKDITRKDVDRARVETRAVIHQANESLGPDYNAKEFRPYYSAEDYVDSKDTNEFYRVSLLTVTTLTELWEESSNKDSDIKLGPEYYMGQINGVIYELNRYEKLRKEHKFELPDLHKEAFQHCMDNNVDRYSIGDKTFVIENVKLIFSGTTFSQGWTRRLVEEEKIPDKFKERMMEFIKEIQDDLIEQQKNMDPDNMYDWEIDQPQFQSPDEISVTKHYNLNMTMKRTGCSKCTFGEDFHKTSPKNTCGEYQK